MSDTHPAGPAAVFTEDIIPSERIRWVLAAEGRKAGIWWAWHLPSSNTTILHWVAAVRIMTPDLNNESNEKKTGWSRQGEHLNKCCNFWALKHAFKRTKASCDWISKSLSMALVISEQHWVYRCLWSEQHWVYRCLSWGPSSTESIDVSGEVRAALSLSMALVRCEQHWVYQWVLVR